MIDDQDYIPPVLRPARKQSAPTMPAAHDPEMAQFEFEIGTDGEEVARLKNVARALGVKP